MALDKARVEEVLNMVRPKLQADGGDIELIEVRDNGEVVVALQGSCRGCPFSQLTLATSVEATLKREIPEVTAVVAQ